MQYIYDFFKYLSGIFKKALAGLMTLPGLLVSGIFGFASLVLSLFGEFDYSTDMVSRIDAAASMLDEIFGVIRSGNYALVDMLVSFLAVDTFVECLVALVTATVAIVVATLFTFLGSFIVFAGGVLLVRGILKVIRICSGGFIDP